ncbi:MAG: T9SS type A sorting domain-containing protein [candidate division WOR-3 bacterium]
MLELCMALVAGSWTETRPQDFMDGWYDPLLYVSRRLQVEGVNPADSGAVEFYPRFDANRDGYYDLVGSDGNGPYIRLFLGSPTGYSNTNVRLFPITSGGACDMADLNLDGWPELIHSGYKMHECRIYWGSQAAGGPDPTNYTTLPHDSAEAVFVNDLDRDTYLDIILAESEAGGRIRVYWGSSGGYNPGLVSYRDDLYAYGHNIEVADLNKDMYEDVVLVRREDPLWGLSILWGDGDRDLQNNLVWFDWVGNNTEFIPHGLTLGDFNKDSWIDIVVTSCDYSFPAEAAVYFSDNGSFSPSNRLILHPSHSYGGSSAWDVNGDGWLDIVCFRGGGGGWNAPLLLYINKGTPPYFSDDDTVRVGYSAQHSGGFLGDFNWDGKADIFANVRELAYDYVYWGVQPTGAYDSVQILSVTYDHHGGFRECGNIYDRSPMAWYESGIFSEPLLQSEARLSWIAWDSTQIGSEVRMYIRTRWDGSSPWTNWREVSNGETVSESPYFPARDIQYRAEFRWRNPSWLPWLEKVELTSLPLSEDEAISGSEGVLRFGSGNGFIWVSWPKNQADVSLYSADGRRIALKSLHEGRAEFRGLRAGVYFIKLNFQEGHLTEKIIVR